MLHRLKEYIDYKNVTVSAFEKSVGMSNASLAKPLRSGGSIGADKLKNILLKYPDLNLTWLITGNGEMLNKPKERKLYPEVEIVSTLNEDPIEYKSRIVLFEKTMENLNILLQEKDTNLRKKEEKIQELEKQLQEKDIQIKELLRALNR